jgi:hypothetical protein
MLELFSKIIRYSLLVIPLFHINLNDTNSYDYEDYELSEIKVINHSMEDISSEINISMSVINEHSPFYTNPTLSLFFIFMVNLFYIAMD